MPTLMCRRCGKASAPGFSHCDPCKAFRAERARRWYADRAVRKLAREVEIVNALQRGYRLGFAAGQADERAAVAQFTKGA